MPTPAPAAKPARRLVERFAGHLAHLLNTGNSNVEVSLFVLHQRLLKTLLRDGNRRLLGVDIAGGDRTPEEVAQKYFEAVLDRRLYLVRDNTTHKGHELLLALCQRGIEPPWPLAVLFRDNGAQTLIEHNGQPRDFSDIAQRLDKVDKSISPRNPAANTREQHGPLQLRAGEGQAEVAEELSLWKAITCAPRKLRKLSVGPEFNAFCSLVIKAVEAANAPYGTLVAIGLSPFDWEGEVSTNTLKKFASFLSDVRGGGDIADIETWRRVWQRRPVPGYASADELWNSELGRAVRLPQVARQDETVDIGGIADDLASPESQLLDPETFAKHLELCRATGVINDFDVWLFRKIEAGECIDDLVSTPDASRFAGQPARFAAYIEELTERVLAWVQRHLDVQVGDSSHPDSSDDPKKDDR